MALWEQPLRWCRPDINHEKEILILKTHLVWCVCNVTNVLSYQLLVSVIKWGIFLRLYLTAFFIITLSFKKPSKKTKGKKQKVTQSVWSSGQKIERRWTHIKPSETQVCVPSWQHLRIRHPLNTRPNSVHCVIEINATSWFWSLVSLMPDRYPSECNKCVCVFVYVKTLTRKWVRLA